MKRRLIVMFSCLLLVFTVPLTVTADSRTWNPPAQKGTIYVLIKYKERTLPENTKVSISWGNWQKSGVFSPARPLIPGRGVPNGGIVIKLKHSKDDSVPLKVETDGKIQNIYQGDQPGECSNKDWKCVNW